MDCFNLLDLSPNLTIYKITKPSLSVVGTYIIGVESNCSIGRQHWKDGTMFVLRLNGRLISIYDGGIHFVNVISTHIN